MTEEILKLIRSAIRQWPQTLRLATILVALSVPTALITLSMLERVR